MPLPVPWRRLGRVDKVDSKISGGVIQGCILESSFGSRPDDGSRVSVLRAFCDHHRQQAGNLSENTRTAYTNRLESIRKEHGHRTVSGLTGERIDQFILAPYADRPGAQLDTLKKMRILIKHAIHIGWLTQDPCMARP